ADQRPDEQVQRDEQRELARVRTQPEPHALRHATAPTSPARLAATIRSCPAGLGGASTSTAAANSPGSAIASSGLWARSKPIDETGLPDSPRPQTDPP